MSEILAVAIGFLLLALGLFVFFTGFMDFYDERLLECTPTSRCRGVALGRVVIFGRAVGLNPIPSFIAHLPSFISKVVVEESERSGRSNEWRAVHKREMRMPFYVKDNSGELKVDPAQAVLWLERDVAYSTETGIADYSNAASVRANEQTDSLDEMFREYCLTRGINTAFDRRFTETDLSPGDPVFVYGTACSGKDSGDSESTIVRNIFWQRLYIVEGDKRNMVLKLRSRGLLRVLGGSLATICATAVLARATTDTPVSQVAELLTSEISIEAEFLSLFAILGAGVFIYGGVIYNGLVSLRNEVERAFSNIDVLLQQRFDLIPNLVSVCKAYMEHESSVMQAVAASRSQWANARERSEKLTAAAVALPPLRKLLATAESYPRLRANENFLQLQEQLTSLEGQLADRRELYNSAVSLFNSRIQIFPDRILANAFRFSQQPFYSAEENAAAVPEVNAAEG
ncbi:MAG TPA: LemA family protein [Terriglobales bacterium]|nr:LemA family protein [Terriglobales bacterium]